MRLHHRIQFVSVQVHHGLISLFGWKTAIDLAHQRQCGPWQFIDGSLPGFLVRKDHPGQKMAWSCGVRESQTALSQAGSHGDGDPVGHAGARGGRTVDIFDGDLSFLRVEALERIVTDADAVCDQASEAPVYDGSPLRPLLGGLSLDGSAQKQSGDACSDGDGCHGVSIQSGDLERRRANHLA